MKTTPLHSNCLIAVLYLLILGKVAKIVAVNSHSRLWPYHYLVVNKNGNILHFRHSRPHEQNLFAPFWFEGQFEGIRRSRAELMLKRSGRTVQFESERTWTAFIVLFAIFCLIFIPFMFFWVAYPALFCAWWSFHAMTKRLKKAYIFPVRRVVDQDG